VGDNVVQAGPVVPFAADRTIGILVPHLSAARRVALIGVEGTPAVNLPDRSAERFETVDLQERVIVIGHYDPSAALAPGLFRRLEEFTLQSSQLAGAREMKLVLVTRRRDEVPALGRFRMPRLVPGD